jgi:predicted nucleic acid-binding protein
LIALARIGHFDLLPRLYENVVVPTEVYNEVVIAGEGLPGAKQVAVATWIQVTAVRDPRALRVAVEETGLGAGEVSAVILAKELAADLLLVDEWKARRFAVAEGLSVKGCIGILESFHRGSLLPDLRRAYIRLLEEKIRSSSAPGQLGEVRSSALIVRWQSEVRAAG